MKKSDNIKQFQEFCKRNNLIEDSNTVSFFCELFRRKETKSNGIAITQLYDYVDKLED